MTSKIEELPQPYAGAITLLETIAEHGALAKFDDGMPTPNSVLCKRFAEQLRDVATLAQRAGSGECAECSKKANDGWALYCVECCEQIPRSQPDSKRDAARICHLIGSIFFAGDFVAETGNERELEQLLIKMGYRYRSWGEIDAAMAAQQSEKG